MYGEMFVGLHSLQHQKQSLGWEPGTVAKLCGIWRVETFSTITMWSRSAPIYKGTQQVI
jgi:hypothetical protein